MNTNLKRFPIALGAGVLLITAYAYRPQRAAPEDAYVTERVDRGSIQATVTATGIVNPVNIVQVGTYVSGPIQGLDVDFNSPVTTGQRVAKIDPAPFQMKVREAEANVRNARAHVEKDRVDLQLKKVTLERDRTLLAKNLIAQSDVDTAQSDYGQAGAQLELDQAALEQAEASLDEARVNLAYTDIRSPVDGVVVSRNVTVGQTVAASFQTPTLFLIAQDLTKMQVDGNVSESDVGSVKVGQPASFTVDAYPGKDFEGTVVQIRKAPITVQNVVTYDVVVGVDNQDLSLLPGMTATVTITTAKRDAALRLPIRALTFKPRTKAPAEPEPAPARQAPPTVWVVKNGGAAQEVKVKTGIQNDRYAELLSGDLHAGDEVAVALRSPAAEHGEPPPSFAGMRH
jgi:HlyD family secretion protein